MKDIIQFNGQKYKIMPYMEEEKDYLLTFAVQMIFGTLIILFLASPYILTIALLHEALHFYLLNNILTYLTGIGIIFYYGHIMKQYGLNKPITEKRILFKYEKI